MTRPPANAYPRLLPRTAACLAALALAVVAAGCGGSKSKSTTTSASHAATAPATSSTAPATPSGKSSVTTGPVRASLTAPNHTPPAGKLWPYAVKVTDAAGKPLAGTVDTEFLFGGQVVGHESPPTHTLKNGGLHDEMTWPAQAVGQPLTLQVVVHTSQGTIALDWPVSVKR